MSRSLRDKNVLLAVTGSIAAYKAVDLIKRLKEEGAEVTTVMTSASVRFVPQLLLEIAGGGKVYRDMFDDALSHIELAREADLYLVAPATANTLGKMAGGIADNLVSALYMAYIGPVVVAPAMNWRMYENPVLRRNLEYLKSLGVAEVQPGEGDLACGEQGRGRLAGIDEIVEAAKLALTPQDLKGQDVIITAGPTREPIDLVRFLSNRSSGRMGYELARASYRRGARVTLVSGPSALTPPPGVQTVMVQTAREMRDEVIKRVPEASLVVMAAAVADFTPKQISEGKLDKADIKNIELDPAPDILAELGSLKHRPRLVGFAAEAGANTKRAKAKMLDKGADMMVMNDITAPGAGFDTQTNQVVIITKDAQSEHPLMSKEDVSELILDKIIELG